MAKFDYNRIRKSFAADSSCKTPEAKKLMVSNQINDFLDSFGSDGWELSFYNEILIEEGTVHLTALFKKRIATEKQIL